MKLRKITTAVLTVSLAFSFISCKSSSSETEDLYQPSVQIENYFTSSEFNFPKDMTIHPELVTHNGKIYVYGISGKRITENKFQLLNTETGETSDTSLKISDDTVHYVYGDTDYVFFDKNESSKISAIDMISGEIKTEYEYDDNVNIRSFCIDPDGALFSVVQMSNGEIFMMY